MNKEIIQANINNCLITRKDFLGSTIYNICDGTEKTVPYGNLEMFFGLILGFVMIILTIMLAKLIKDIFKY